MVLKRSGATEPFTREKAISGVRKACQGRPVEEDALALLALDGELVLATRWELDAELRMDWEDQVKLLFRASCLHWRTNGWHDKIPALLKGASTNMMPLKPTDFHFCRKSC